MSKKMYGAEELVTALTVDGVAFAPVATLLKTRAITMDDINKLQSAYAIIHKNHARCPEILIHIAGILQCLKDEPLSALGRSLQFEDKGIDFHAMQVSIVAMEKPSWLASVKKFFKPAGKMDVKDMVKKVVKDAH